MLQANVKTVDNLLGIIVNYKISDVQMMLVYDFIVIMTRSLQSV